MGIEEELRKVAELINRSRLTIALSGAGMSTESGIPDFRSPGVGIWEKIDPMKFAHIGSYTKGFDLKEIMKLTQGMDISKLTHAEPNEGHKALAELEKMGKLSLIITQNVDMLHQKAGSKNVTEVHGSIQTSSCMRCKRKMEMEEFLKRVIEQQKIPPICDCGGIIKPDVVFFGEALPQDALKTSLAYAQKCELMLVCGSSLVVYPVAELPQLAKRSGANLVIINLEKTPYDGTADVVIHRKVGESLPRIVEEAKALARRT
jgi:NAD-dependent deacetylase